jgi:hypothetical protein
MDAQLSRLVEGDPAFTAWAVAKNAFRAELMAIAAGQPAFDQTVFDAANWPVNFDRV